LPKGVLIVVKKSDSVPKEMQEKYAEIVALTDQFSQKYLNEEYAQLIRLATAALSRKRPSPIVSGKASTWACGITHAIGMVNFLYDSSQSPYISAKELYKIFGVGESTGQGKSKVVRDTLKMHQMDPNWSLPSTIDNNPMAWLVSINGLIVDARSATVEVQEKLVAMGVIPYVPGQNKQDGIITITKQPSIDPIPVAKKSTAKKSSAKTTTPASPDAVYDLDVFIAGGPVTEAFAATNPIMSRRIAIQGINTLKDLHQIIFAAFDRSDEHMYEFQIGGSGPYDPKARRYTLKSATGKKAGEVSQTTIASLGLSIEECFGYWFDFGDDWWHQINVMGISEPTPKGKYPKITERVGASPPQYADFDQE
jgi:hypothetical protein